MNYRRGDVVLVMFPDSNLRTAKRRPALVVQADNLKTGLNQTIVAMITSNLARSNHPSRISVDIQTAEGQISGLRLNSVIMTDNISAIIARAIDRKIGIWTNMAIIETALSHTFDLP